MQHVYTLVVLTLLQLCRAEIPEWYAANLINDAEYPKPITEIFTTPDTFSSKNPIIVTSTAYPSETEEVFSTVPNSKTTQTTSNKLSRSSEDTTQRVIPLQEGRPSSSRPSDSDILSQTLRPTPQRENRPTSSQSFDRPVQMYQPQPQQENPSSSIQSPDTPRQTLQPLPQRENVPTSSQPFDRPIQMYQPQPQRENPSSSIQSPDTPRQSLQSLPQRENGPTSSQPFDRPIQMNQPQSQRENPSSSIQSPDTPRQTLQPLPRRENSPTSSQPFDRPIQMNQPQSQRENPSSSIQSPDTPRQIYQPPPQQIQVLVAQPQIQPSQKIQASPLVPTAVIPSSPQIQLPMQPITQQQTTGQPNYFLIYQQAPLSIQQYPALPAQSRQSSPSMTQITQTTETQRTTQVATNRTTTQPSTTTEMEAQTTQATRILSIPHPSSAPRNIRQEQIGYWPDPSGAIFFNPPISSTIPPGAIHIPCLNSSLLRRNATTQRPIGRSGLMIRVTAPRGSITKIKINPSTTTKKPSTRRSQRRKGNNYNNCVESCKGKKEPLCAAPLAVLPIDPNSLRGFPSICHLACHNSFRKNQPFEKVMDGRCSRLRTRIRTFDQNKLKREELNKAQYTVLNNIPETVVQVIQNE